MPAHVRPHRQPIRSIDADLPPSKSHAQRAMLLAGFGGGECVLRGVGDSEDVSVCLAAAAAAGVDLEACGLDVVVHGFRPNWGDAPAQIWCDENGTCARMFGGILAAIRGHAVLDGSTGLRARPMAALVAALRSLGVQVEGAGLPLTIDARPARWSGSAEVDGETTTQVASGIMLGLAVGGGPAPTLRVRRPRAANYVHLTAHLIRQFGREVTVSNTGDDLEIVFGTARGAAPAHWTTPPDPSAIAFPACLAAMHGARYSPPDSGDDPHPDWKVLDDVERVRRASPEVELTLDQIALRPDGFPALAALAATRRGVTRFVDAPALRAKESDRIAAMAAGLRAIGVEADEHDDGLVVRGPVPQHARAVSVPAPSDHRIVMALALLGTTVSGGVVIDAHPAVAKSWPGFWTWLGRHAEVELTGAESPS